MQMSSLCLATQTRAPIFLSINEFLEDSTGAAGEITWSTIDRLLPVNGGDQRPFRRDSVVEN